MRKRIITAITVALLLLFSTAAFSAITFNSITTNPRYLCAGAVVTITINMTVTVSEINQIAAFFSADTTIQNTNDWVILRNGATFPTTAVNPGWGMWSMTGYAAPALNWPVAGPLTMSFTTTVPAGLPSTVNIIVGLTNNGFVEGASPRYSQAFTVNCNLKQGTNTGNMLDQQATAVFFVDLSCSATTPTITRTMTPTFTRTVTPTITFTRTPTFTSTNTKTMTPTFTLTNTPTNTPPPYTPTVTPTITMTFTKTSTPTVTHTRTYTPTITETSFNSATVTKTITSTNTPTPTHTQTSTYTNTQTNTPTRTNTPTITETAMFTATVTKTITQTSTPTFTLTSTQTITPTRTPTPTYTNTEMLTFTATRTITPTMTATFTVTSTFTITPTPPPYPYVLMIELYNEAGERVKILANTLSTSGITDASLYTVNFSGTPVISSVYNISSETFQIYIPGTNTPEQPVGNGSTFVWTGENSNGQEITAGHYYIKISVRDEFGHTDTLNRDVTILKNESYVQISIFSPSGELVRNIKEYTSVVGNLMTLPVNTIFINKEGAGVQLKYGSDAVDYMDWDGRNEHGVMVQNGVYTIQVEAKTETGVTVNSKSITILTEKSDSAIGDVKIIPNPFVHTIKLDSLIFTWTGAPEGDMQVRIFNCAGELVKTVYGKGTGGVAYWDGKSTGWEKASSGIYTAVFTAKKTNGQVEMKTEKLAVITK